MKLTLALLSLSLILFSCATRESGPSPEDILAKAGATALVVNVVDKNPGTRPVLEAVAGSIESSGAIPSANALGLKGNDPNVMIALAAVSDIAALYGASFTGDPRAGLVAEAIRSGLILAPESSK